FLRAVAAGEEIMAYGSGAALHARSKGEGYVLHGQAMFVPFADVADHLVLAAQEEGSGESVVCIVGSDHVLCEPLHTIGSGREHRVCLDGVEVSADGVLGRENGSAVSAMIETHGTAALCAEMVGGAQKVLDMTVDFANEREQFGRPIRSFQAVQHHCANMATDILGSRLIAYEAIWHLSEGYAATEPVSAAKAWVSEAYRRVCALGHQVHGAIGFTHEHDLHYYLRHAISAEVTFGDSARHYERVAQTLGL
ncbi:MAG: acyl-CoA dehydrogenase, partial [Gammaproteobacteria bacterium]